MPTVKELIRAEILGVKGLVAAGGSGDSDRTLLISDADKLTRMKVIEYATWYGGDGDELLNLYTRKMITDFWYEPFHTRNKQAYFWSVAGTENDIKRTHSGQPRNIVDTLVGILPFPDISESALPDQSGPLNSRLHDIIADSGLKGIYRHEQLPLTLVEGWGCYKINWDRDVSDYPIPVYYRANNVDFIYTYGRVTGAIFKDWYTDGKDRKYLLTETRFVQGGSLRIRKRLYRLQGDGTDCVTEARPDDVPELAGMDMSELIVEGYRGLLATPCVIFRETEQGGGYGRSIFTGKIDLFDDLDQCLSQAANAVRRSTVTEYYNTDFLERDDKTGLPKQPKALDRKYIMYAGQKSADGTSTSDSPVTVTQPDVNFQQYSDHAVQIMLQIINGIMSPATLGIDISKKDNAEAQREKEKVTIFTRNLIADSETEILKGLCGELMCAKELMDTGRITRRDYSISVRFSEFADASFENKLEILGKAYDCEQISDEMYMRKLYGYSLTDTEWQKELEWLKEHHTQPKDQGMLGMLGGGSNLPGDDPFGE